MQAIVTKYLGPTDFRGSRVKAYAEAGTITLNWDHGLDITDNHDAAAIALARKFGWDKHTHKMVRGGLPQTSKYAYCYTFIKDWCEVSLCNS